MTDHRGSVASPVGAGAANSDTVHTSLRAHLTARLFANRLDRQLAVGFTGSAGSALAIHALRLESDKERYAIARALRRAVTQARYGRPPHAPSVPVHRRNIANAEDLIDTITLRLHSPRRIGVKGMARLRLLLSDGCGPMYEHGRGDLAGRLRAALAAL